MKRNLNLIGLSGKIKSGKSTLAGELSKRGYNVKSFASPIKAIVSLATGIPIEKLNDQEVKDSYLPMEWDYIIEQRMMMGGGNITRVPVRYRMKVRDLFLKVGTDMGRVVHSNFWVNTFFNTWNGEKTVCDDVRFHNEAESFRQAGGILIRLNSTRCNSSKSAHISETALDDYPYFDLVLDSDRPVEELVDEVLRFIEVLPEQLVQ